MQFPRVVAGVVCVLAEVLAAGPFDWQCYPVDAQMSTSGAGVATRCRSASGAPVTAC